MASSKFNKEISNKLISLAHKGMRESSAARLAGIHPQTLKKWLAEGERGIPEFEQFYIDFNKAIATSELDAIDYIRDAGDVKAIQWFLSTRFRESWGNQIKVDQTVEVKNQVLEELLDLLESKLDPEVFDLVVDAFSSDES